MIMKIANIFEKKILLSLGRHLWNILGISGFIGLLTGFILFIEGNTLETTKSRERYFGRNNYVTNSKIEEVTENMLSYEEWAKEEGTINENLLSLDEWYEKNSIKIETLASDDEYRIYRDDFFEKASIKYDDYVLYKKPFDKEQKRLTQVKKEQESQYSNYLEGVKDRNRMKGARVIISPLVMGYGLAVIASASLSSAVLAIERNLRDKK